MYDSKEVVRLRLAGARNKEIAEQLGISPRIVAVIVSKNKISKPNRGRLTQLQIEEIISLCESRLAVAEIAERMKVPEKIVYATLRRNDCTIVPANQKLKDQIAALYLKGVSRENIAAQVSKSIDTVCRILIEMGLRKRRFPVPYIPFAEARAIVRDLKLTSKRHWYAYVHDHKDKLIAQGIRLHPHHYKEFAGFKDWLGVGATQPELVGA